MNMQNLLGFAILISVLILILVLQCRKSVERHRYDGGKQEILWLNGINALQLAEHNAYNGFPHKYEFNHVLMRLKAKMA